MIKKTFFVTVYIFLLFVLPSNSKAQKKQNVQTNQPKLIVSIIIEGMRYDYLYRWQKNFEASGFKQLIKKGTICENAQYNYLLTQTSPGMATIVSGCEPSLHGIIADKWYKRINNKIAEATYDPKIHDLNNPKSGFSYSPHSLQTSTFSDELKLFNHNQTKAVSVSFEPETAVIGGGHKANFAYWFDEKTGNFTSSSYYSDALPEWVDEFNSKKLPDLYLKNEWFPLLSAEQYENYTPNSDKKVSEFAKNFKKTTNTYSSLKASPYSISLTKDFAIAEILNDSLGKSATCDYINICFTATSEVSKRYGTDSKELEDIYLRLDREIAHLLQFLHTYLGKEQVLIFLSSTNGSAYSPKALAKQKIPSGEFDGTRATMLLQSYLNVIYGKGKWLNAYLNKQIYLNRNLIEDSLLNLNEIQERSARFLTQFSGVANAVTANTLEKTFFQKGIFSYIQNSFNQNRSGDILINLNPGWIERNNEKTQANSAYNYDTHVPLIWYGWKIKESKISRKINLTDIAPTISYLLKIPSANGSTGKAIIELNVENEK